MIQPMNFPDAELESLRERLDLNEPIYTTRISDEVGAYFEHQIYKTPLGNLEVQSIDHFDNLEDHPFYDDLTDDQIEEIHHEMDSRGIDLIELTKA